MSKGLYQFFSIFAPVTYIVISVLNIGRSMTGFSYWIMATFITEMMLWFIFIIDRKSQVLQKLVNVCRELQEAEVFRSFGIMQKSKGDMILYINITGIQLKNIKNALKDITLDHEAAIAKIIYNHCSIYPTVSYTGYSEADRLANCWVPRYFVYV